MRFFGAANGPSAVDACVMRVGCSIRLSTPPSDSGELEDLRAGDELDCLLFRFGEEGDHAAEVAHLARSDFVSRMLGQARVQDLLDARVP